jgi:cell division protease FtsH
VGFLEGEERNYSDETARAIDAQIKVLVSREHDRARRILREKRRVLERIAKELIEKETLSREDLERLEKENGQGRRDDVEVYTSDLP